MPPKQDKNTMQTQTGQGKFVFPNGNIYEGDYLKEGELTYRHGNGVFQSFNQQSTQDVALTEEQRSQTPPIYNPHDIVRLEGQWLKDVFVEGKIVFGTGSSYEGKLKDLNYENGGKYTFPSGVSYTGEFVNNMIHGVGVVQVNGAKLEKAVYRNNYGPGLSNV